MLTASCKLPLIITTCKADVNATFAKVTKKLAKVNFELKAGLLPPCQNASLSSLHARKLSRSMLVTGLLCSPPPFHSCLLPTDLPWVGARASRIFSQHLPQSFDFPNSSFPRLTHHKTFPGHWGSVTTFPVTLHEHINKVPLFPSGPFTKGNLTATVLCGFPQTPETCWKKSKWRMKWNSISLLNKYKFKKLKHNYQRLGCKRFILITSLGGVWRNSVGCEYKLELPPGK